MKTNYFSLLASILLLASCGTNIASGDNSNIDVSGDAGSQMTSLDNDTSIVVDSSTSEGDYTPSSDDISIVLANGASTTTNSTNVAISSNVITISVVGTYIISGTLTEGQIIVNAPKSGTVEDVVLVLNGVSISCSSGAPIYSKGKAKLQINKATNSVNYVCDNRSSSLASTYTGDDNAAIFSDKKLKIFGKGKLTVDAQFNNGIASDKGIELREGNLIISSYNHSIKSHEKIDIGGTVGTHEEGAFKLKSVTGSCIRSDSELTLDEDTTDYFKSTLTQGYFVLVSEYDAIEIDGYLLISGGEFDITTGGLDSSYYGSNSKYTLTSDMPSRKGIKADQSLTIEGGTVNIDSFGDAVHSNNNVSISGGNFNVSCATQSKLKTNSNEKIGSNGIHADLTVDISNDAVINIIKSYEGIEGRSIIFDGGTTYINSSDDGVNATADTITSDVYIKVNSGYLFVDALGDGLDSNANMYFNGGVTVVSGPTNGGNGPLDCGDGGNYYIQQDGGILVAYGSSGMSVGVTKGNQYSFLVNHSSVVSSNSYYLVCNSSDQVLYAIQPIAKASSSSYAYSLAFSSKELATGTYYLKYTSSYTIGNEIFKQVYVNGSASSSTSLATLSFTSSNTHISSGSGGGHSGPGGR